MIRINLLGTPKTKRGKRAVAAAGETSKLLTTGTLILVLAAVAGNGLYYWKLMREGTQIQSDLRSAEAENRRLSDVKVRYLEREKIKNFYKHRVDVIDQLRANQSGPVRLLATMGNTVNQTDAVWLSTMADDGSTITLKGYALSVHGVAELMRNLQRTGYFRSVEIKETYQNDQVKNMQSFVFTLLCQKQPQQPATAPAKGAVQRKS